MGHDRTPYPFGTLPCKFSELEELSIHHTHMLPWHLNTHLSVSHRLLRLEITETRAGSSFRPGSTYGLCM